MTKVLTSRDVAKALGIAQSTVSRAFTPGAPISPDLRERVHAAAAALGYRPNLLARGLIAGRSRLIGVLIAPQTNLLYPELLYELGRRLAAEDHQLLLFTVADEDAAARAIDRLQSFRVDAVLATGILGEAGARELVAANIPLVTFNRLIEGVAGVSCDFAGAAEAMSRELLKQGRKRFALIGGPRTSWVSTEFERGVRAALGRTKGARLAIEHVPYAYDEGPPALHRAEQKLDSSADAILCVNDVVAKGCLAHLAKNGKSARTLSGLIWTISRSAIDETLLSGMHQPIEGMIEAAVKLLLARGATGSHMLFSAKTSA